MGEDEFGKGGKNQILWTKNSAEGFYVEEIL
jgi:hypothetical protein